MLPYSFLKYKIIALGCRTNQYEAQALQDQLESLGYVSAQAEEAADLCIINGCAVTLGAASTTRQKIKKIIKENPKAYVVVTGCLDKNIAIEGVSLVIPNEEKETLIAQVCPNQIAPKFAIKGFQEHTRAFVKIQDGCNSFCSYCIIPYLRGRSRSRPINEILEEIAVLGKNGYSEIVLTGINIGDFKIPSLKRNSLACLLEEIAKIDAIKRIRLSSINPNDLDDDLTSTVLKTHKICPSLHLSLQSGSDLVLTQMNRPYTSKFFAQKVEGLRKGNPDFTFTTDIIVGFPGETEACFQETLDFIEKICFLKVHCFPYSPRPGTRAMRMTPKIPKQIITKRGEILRDKQDQITEKLQQSFLGRKMEILTEKTATKNLTPGHTPNFLHVWIEGKNISSNQLIQVKLIQSSPKGLLGEILCS